MRTFRLDRWVRGGSLLLLVAGAGGCGGEAADVPERAPRLRSAALEGEQPITLVLSDAGVEASSGLYPVACEDWGSLRALSSSTPVDVTFTNDGEDWRVVYWLGFDGTPLFYNSLPPHSSYTQGSYSGHPWLITDLDGRCTSVVLTMGHGVRSGPLTLASEGVAVLSSDEVTPENLSAIEMGGEVIAVDDPTRVSWVEVPVDTAAETAAGPSEGAGTLADPSPKAELALAASLRREPRLLLKAPEVLGTGTQLVRLTTTAGRTLDWAFESVEPAFAPDPPAGILWTESFAQDDPFPVLTEVEDHFILGDETAERGHWFYVFNAYPAKLAETCSDIPRHGFVGGNEAFFPDGVSRGDPRLRQGCADARICNRLVGSYQLGPEGNSIDVTIQRGEAEPERYIGGWAGNIPADPAQRGQLPPPEGGDRYVVLTSTLTGRQIAFQYFLLSSCDPWL